MMKDQSVAGNAPASPDERFWQLAAEILKRPDVERSTMMGFPCLRFRGRFFASLDSRAGSLIVKLSQDEVRAAIHSGEGIPFAPAGRRFREWLAVPHERDITWNEYLDRALAFAGESR